MRAFPKAEFVFFLRHGVLVGLNPFSTTYCTIWIYHISKLI